MPTDPLSAVAEAVFKHTRDNMRPPAKLPATVVSVDGSVASVLIDLDDDPVPIATLVTVTEGQRVMVEGRPGLAAYVVAVI